AVAGTVALMLQANPRLSVAQIKEVIGNTAINDQYTGNLRDNDSVSIRWGHGKINAYRCVNGAIDKLDIDEVVALNAPLQVYPNPTTDRITVLTFTNMECLVEVYAIQGSKVMQQRVEGGEACLDVQGLEKGIYVVRCQDRSGIRTAKFVKL
ncbi:MAG: T9SS type A sorting domain-containing protein, partial [Bacteroidales bacterium]|nr:T9SS type A sorting domain-containing protein [Bacteroidales bacterium]